LTLQAGSAPSGLHIESFFFTLLTRYLRIAPRIGDEDESLSSLESSVEGELATLVHGRTVICGRAVQSGGSGYHR